ncbi:MAG: BACON domain-containing carbohydrate-binding protein [Bacteroidales bacterium]|nr:BACON domain-containing carbohydrate-binding protein [Bacteroidales bacterium]
MKLKNYILALAAVLTLGATSCEDMNEKTFLSEVQVSSSYLAFDAAGSSETIEVKAHGSWEFVELPSWLSANPASGQGSATVTFTAQAATDTRQGSFFLTCNGAEQRINYIQQTEKKETPLSSCKEVNSGIEGVTYRAAGVITKIAESAKYGNFYFSDGTGEVYVYGTKYNGATQQGALEKLGLNVGDYVVVEGPLAIYSGTYELKDADIVSYEKSLIKCDSTMVAGVKSSELPLEGGELVAMLTCKGKGVSVSVPSDAQSWLSVISVKTAGEQATVTFLAAPNVGGDRSTTITFTTNDGKKEYTSQTSFSQKGAIVACSVADFLAQPVGDAQFRLTGVITSLNGKNCYIRDHSGDVLVYNPNLNGLTVKEGDIITVVGKRAAYKDSPQMGSPVVEAVQAVEAISLAEFKALADDKNKLYLITGKVAEPTEPNTKYDLETYGNFSLVAEDGTELYVYGVSTGVGGETKKFGTLGVKEGDELTIIAYKTSYTKNDYTLMQAGGAMYVGHTAAE